MDYGAAGYGLYWYCIELIAKDVTPKNITFELEHDMRIIARNLNLSAKEVQDMMKKMIEIGLFDLSVNKKIMCVKLAYRLDDSMRKGRQIGDILANFETENGLVGKIPNDSGKSTLDKEEDKEEDKEPEEEIDEDVKRDMREEFKLFWSSYPKKVAKDTALKAWIKRKDLPPIEYILDSLDRYKKTKQVIDGFTKNPSTWINGGCWDDEHEAYIPKQQQQYQPKQSMGAKVDDVMKKYYGNEPIKDAEVLG